MSFDPEQARELAEQLAAIAKEPIQMVGRKLEELATELDELEQAAAGQLAIATTDAAALEAAIQQAYCAGAKTMLGIVVDAIFGGLSGH